MTVRTFLLGSLVSAIMFWGIWALIVMWVDPASIPIIGVVLFFLSFFLAVASTAALLGYGMRRLVSPSQFPAYRVRTSLRQALILGGFMDLLLFLQMQRLLRWWVTIIMVILVLSIEFIFLSYDRGIGRHQKTKETGSRNA